VKLPPRINPYPILGLLTEMHENLRELQDQTSESQGIFAGIVTSIGSILEAAGEGTSKVIEALGKGINKVSSRRSRNPVKRCLSSSGDALADTIKAG